MTNATEHTLDLIFGRWREQTLYAGVELGVFDALARDTPKSADAVAAVTGADAALLYRLMRAQAAIGLLVETPSRAFVLTEAGELLRRSNPASLAPMVRLEASPQHYALWKHLPAMVREGKQNAFVREFGCMAFDHALANEDYGSRFKQAMTSYSAAQSPLVLEALSAFDFSNLRTVCDVAGGYGHFMCSLLQAHSHMRGIVLDLPDVVSDANELRAPKLGLESRCDYVAGDMFEMVPEADAYFLKMILHDWNDAECIEILCNIREASRPDARVMIIEHVVPAHDVPHFSKLFDVHMMCWGTGRERTEAEYGQLLRTAGWVPGPTYYPANRQMGVVTAHRS